ncbi:NAD(P)-dependent alcohol dehydrogenase [Sphingobium sp. Z007]|uniref:NAD(P)-dependent alcohol dehydrogenase n=1 Tax=Sphingobium sp. Z007 TaxID=627495 RepID=UPI000B498552|nr:NAD(P)-dependent alcohol dehydrogenase [Sphingobium sp. Z007]
MEIQAAVAHGNGQPLMIEAIDLDEPQANEILVRIVATGICGTDLGILSHAPLPWPAVLGHEGAGIVEHVGSAVTGIAPGDHVVLTTTSCGRCATCQQGQPSFCMRFRAVNMSGGRRADGSCTHHQHGKPAFGGFLGQSSFAAYVLATERNAIKIDKDLPLDVMAPFGCGIQTGAAAVLNTLKVQAGKSLVVFGAGAVGLSALMAAKIAGCGPLIVVDTKADRLALAMELGATRTINPLEEDAVALLQADGGVDYAVEATGIASVMENAVNALGVNGVAVLVGVAPGQKVAIDPTALQSRGLTVMGTIMAGRDGVPALFVRKLIDFWKEGKLPVEKLIRYYEFSEINEAIAAAKDGSAVKPILRLPMNGETV